MLVLVLWPLGLCLLVLRGDEQLEAAAEVMHDKVEPLHAKAASAATQRAVEYFHPELLGKPSMLSHGDMSKHVPQIPRTEWERYVVMPAPTPPPGLRLALQSSWRATYRPRHAPWQLPSIAQQLSGFGHLKISRVSCFKGQGQDRGLPVRSKSRAAACGTPTPVAPQNGVRQHAAAAGACSEP